MSDSGYLGIFVLIGFVTYLCYDLWGGQRDEWKRKYEELSSKIGDEESESDEWKRKYEELCSKIEDEGFEEWSRLTPSQKKQVDEYIGKRLGVKKKKYRQ